MSSCDIAVPEKEDATAYFGRNGGFSATIRLAVLRRQCGRPLMKRSPRRRRPACNFALYLPILPQEARRLRRGFTLIELLVVIAIIAILAGLLFPVFARAKAQAKTTACLSNLHQIGSAITLYMGDYDDVFPHALDASDKWAPEIWSSKPDFQNEIPKMPLMTDVLQPYLKSYDVFHCPSDTGTYVLDNNFPMPFNSQPAMWKKYGSSYFFRTEIAFRAFTQTTFKLPANVNVLFDGAGHWHGDGRPLQPDDGFAAFSQLVRLYRYNTLFGDMHAKNLSFDSMQAAWATDL